MSDKLCIIACDNFGEEVRAAIAAEGWTDVVSAKLPARCGQPPLSWEELRSSLPQDCTHILALGSACLGDLRQASDGMPPIRMAYLRRSCQSLVAGSTLASEAIADGGYLMTPEWLADWRRHAAAMGFATDGSRNPFKDFARRLVLFDTGIDPDAKTRLEEMAAAVGLPAARIGVGLDHTRLLLARCVLEWRLDLCSGQKH